MVLPDAIFTAGDITFKSHLTAIVSDEFQENLPVVSAKKKIQLPMELYISIKYTHKS